MFRTLSKTTFGSPEYHLDIRVQVGVNKETKRSYFGNFIDGDIFQYVSLIRDTYYQGVNLELVAFSELY